MFGDHAWEIMDGDEEALATWQPHLPHWRSGITTPASPLLDHASRKQMLAHVVVGP